MRSQCDPSTPGSGRIRFTVLNPMPHSIFRDRLTARLGADETYCSKATTSIQQKGGMIHWHRERVAADRRRKTPSRPRSVDERPRTGMHFRIDYRDFERILLIYAPGSGSEVPLLYLATREQATSRQQRFAPIPDQEVEIPPLPKKSTPNNTPQGVGFHSTPLDAKNISR